MRARRRIEEEIRFHLDARVRDLVRQGWDPDAARSEALRRFGDPGGVSRHCIAIDEDRERRGTMTIVDLLDDVGYAFRQMRKRPLFTGAAVVVLGLGIGAATAVFRVADAALVRALPFPEANRLVYLQDVQTGGELAPASLPEYVDWKREGDFLDAVTLFFSVDATLVGPEGPERVSEGLVDSGFLDVIGLPPVVGRGLRDDDRGRGVVALAEPFWRSRFGADPGVVGSTVVVDDRPLEVVGVLPAEARILPDRPGVQLWSLYREQPWMSRGLHFLRVFGRLGAGVDPASADQRAAAMARGLQGQGVTDHGVALRGVRGALVGDSRTLLLLLTGAVALLLLLVCTNLANLHLAAAGEREREFAVRAALGAGRSRLVRQILTESALLGLLGGGVGLVVSRFAGGYVIRAAGDAALLTPDVLLDPRVLAFVVVTSLLTGLVFGTLPSRRAARVGLAPVLSTSGGTTPGRRSRARRALLVGFETALSLVLLAGATLMMRSLGNLLSVDPGFDPHGVLVATVTLPANRYPDDAAQAGFWRRLLVELRRLPGVREAALTSHTPLAGSDTNGTFEIVGRTYSDEEAPHSKKRIVSAGYFEAMRIPLLRGRAFDETDLPESPEVAIVSQSLAERFWPGEDPVGRLIRFSWGPGDVQEIVGVVGDVRHDGLDLVEGGTLYVPDTQFPFPGFDLVLRTSGDPLSLAGAVREAVLDLDPALPTYDVTTLQAVVDRSATVRRTFTTLLSGFAVVALLLATVGVYAVTAGMVARRTREIGVRRAVGAGSFDVQRLILTEELPGIALGLAAGIGGALAVTGTLRGLLFGITSDDPATLASVTALLAGVALAAVWLPVRRASGIDPMEALRPD